jgi:hypothetical protein
MHGSSHATALTSTTTSGGESPGPAGAIEILESSHAMFEEPLPPETHDFSSCVEPLRDLEIRQALSREQDHLCPNDRKVWQRILCSEAL